MVRVEVGGCGGRVVVVSGWRVAEAEGRGRVKVTECQLTECHNQHITL